TLKMKRSISKHDRISSIPTDAGRSDSDTSPEKLFRTNSSFIGSIANGPGQILPPSTRYIYVPVSPAPSAASSPTLVANKRRECVKHLTNSPSAEANPESILPPKRAKRKDDQPRGSIEKVANKILKLEENAKSDLQFEEEMKSEDYDLNLAKNRGESSVKVNLSETLDCIQKEEIKKSILDHSKLDNSCQNEELLTLNKIPGKIDYEIETKISKNMNTGFSQTAQILSAINKKTNYEKPKDNKSKSSVSDRINGAVKKFYDNSNNDVTYSQKNGSESNSELLNFFSQVPKLTDHRHVSRKSMLPVISSAKIIERFKILYKSGDSYSGLSRNEQSIRNVSPTHKYPLSQLTNYRYRFPCVQVAKQGHLEYDPILDLRQTTQMIVEHCIPPHLSEKYFGTTKKGPLREVIRSCNRFRGSLATPSVSTDGCIGLELVSAIATMNKCLATFKSETPDFVNESMTQGPAANFKLVSHILEQAYARSVAPDSDRLNWYKGFSNNVYGEVKHGLVDEFIKNADIKPYHIFLDMGSGIGNVVLQVASQCLCESYGIEIMEIPSLLAQRQKLEFLSRMRYYAKPCGKIRLKQGDFLEDSEISEVLKRTDVIFVN
ncbi:Nucleosomal histone H3-Lys79 methylase, partial [Nowakowskiella sp. JEL0078]